jgi:hypothetical protein
VWDVRLSGRSDGDGSSLSSPLGAVGLEADLLAQLQLHHAAIVDHQFDRPEADRPQCVPQLAEELGRERERVIVTVLQAGRDRVVDCHVPIYPIYQIE